MKFYDQLSKYYDEVFPLKAETYHFLKKRIVAGRVLDVGCSTGAYAAKLNENDEIFVKGIDLNEEMIKRANDRVGSASFYVQDMREIKDKDKYSLIYSIGNTLVHLHNYEEIKSVIGLLLDALTKKGKLVIQIVNYARVFKQSVTELPEIQTKHVKFSRFYQHKEGKILFKTILKTKLNKYTSEVLLYPATKDELELIAEQLKAKVTFYGSFDEEPFTNASFHLIAVFKK